MILRLILRLSKDEVAITQPTRISRIVIAGLDPAIQESPDSFVFSQPWMPGSSPGMTSIYGWRR
jgi:hypothetical protein